ncbi:MAG: hypothetical protein ACI9H8_002140 [Lysobacterales bacterium]|jgi:hypothetical protein
MKIIKTEIQWGRLAIEAAVIILSILLAFAIDAWWDQNQQQKLAAEQLVRVKAELESNAEIIEFKLKTLTTAVHATSKFQSWMGPEPENISLEVFSEQWVDMVSIGFFTLLQSAGSEFMATGLVAEETHAGIRVGLSEWFNDGNDLEQQYAMLREAHTNFMDHLNKTTPIMHVTATNPVMSADIQSKFPFDPNLILTDPVTENLLGQYLIRMEFFRNEGKFFLEKQSELIKLVDSEILN